MGSHFDDLNAREMQRRDFLGGLAALGAAGALAATTGKTLAAEELMQSATAPAATPTTKPVGQRGRVLNIRDEIKEFKDPKTGARIRQLTSDGSNNVHPYFTSWA